jgi:hypothetical protein
MTENESPAPHGVTDLQFSGAIIKPTDVFTIWNHSKVQQAILDHIANHFKPKNSYEPERVDYNCINIFAEYQNCNLNFAKNTLFLNDCQTANLLDMFWCLLEFDPENGVTYSQGGTIDDS